MERIDRSKYILHDALYEIDLAEYLLDAMDAKKGLTLWGRIASIQDKLIKKEKKNNRISQNTNNL